MPEIVIRGYEDTDLVQCRRLWAELTQHHRDIYEDQSIGGDESGLNFDKHLERVGSENVWVAEKQDEVVGMTGLIIEGSEAEVEPLIVTVDERNKGFGMALLEFAIEKARETGIRYLSIRPVARNKGAISLFHKSGFRIVGHIEMFMDLSEEKRIEWKSGLSLSGFELKY